MPPVILIHGLIGHMRDPVMENAIAQPVFNSDLPGYAGNALAGPVDVDSQVEWVYRYYRAQEIEAAHVVGHSVGGAIAMLLALRHPEFVRSVVNVEGNFTLKDAFWSRSIAKMELPEVDALLNAHLAHPEAWLEQSGVRATPERVALGVSHLKNQTAATVRGVARSIVEVTSSPRYLDDMRAVMGSGIPVHLIAGSRSRDGWDVPAFVLEAAQSHTLIPDTGHLVTIESPRVFGETVRRLVAQVPV